jgi:hypothetical protein
LDSTLTKALLFSVLLTSAWNPLPASAAPKDIVLLPDSSRSMKKKDPEFQIGAAARNFLDELSGNDRIALVILDPGMDSLMPLTPVDDTSRAEFLRNPDRITFEGLHADSPAAVERAIHELEVHARPEAGRSVVFITGGMADTGNPVADARNSGRHGDDAAAEAAPLKIRISGIAIDDDTDFPLVQSLSKQSFGEYFRADSAGDMQGVFRRVAGNLAGTRTLADDSPSTPTRAEAETAPATLPEPAPLPELELPDVEPLFFDSPADPESPENAASDQTVELPVIEDIGAARRPALPTLPKAKTAIETASDSKADQQAAHAGESSGAMTPAERTEAGPPVAQAQPKTILSAAAAYANRREALVASVWLAALLAAGLIGMALTVGLTLRGGGKADDKRMLEDQLPKAFLNDLGGISDKPSYELGESLTVVGRIKGGDADRINYVVIPEPTVGRRHALIEFRNHCFWVSDQNSLNGTFVNDERIEGDARLKHGDRIRFHRHEFEFLLLDMFETDRTKSSQTAFADVSRAADWGDRIQSPAPKDADMIASTLEEN